jgi:hypothetical protein
MSALWRLLMGTDPSRSRRAPRPQTGLRPEVSALEGRQLMHVSMGTTVPQGTTLLDGTVLTSNFVLPAVQVTPKVLFPSDGRYVPIQVSGGLNSTYAMTLNGRYAVFPKPAYTAQVLAQLPLPDPTSTTPVQTGVVQTYTAFDPASKTSVTVPFSFITYTPPSITTVGGVPVLNPGLGIYSVTLPGFKYPEAYGFIWQGSLEKNTDGSYVISPRGIYQVGAKDLPVSDFEKLVIDARLNNRRGPSHVVSQTTDQYRQDEPHVVSPLTLLAAPSIAPFGAPVPVLANTKAGIKYTQQISIPTGYGISRSYSYNFTIHLQAQKHSNTGGRQYIVNVASEDADDGGSANTAVVVPSNA